MSKYWHWWALIALGAGLLLAPSVHAKTIYKYVDSETGTVTYSDVPPTDMTNVHTQQTESRRYDASMDAFDARMRRLLLHYDALYSDPANLRSPVGATYQPAARAPVGVTFQPVTRSPQVTIARDGPEDPGLCRQLLAYQFGDVGLLGRRPWASEQRDAIYYRNRYGC